jgi:hypothetical protein
MNEYQEYPKWLHHPGSQPAVISVPPTVERGKLRADQAPGAPMTYPPVMVHNPDDEAYYVARGYSSGASNRGDYERQTIAPPPAGFVQRDFPMYGEGGLIIQDPNAPPPDIGEYPKYVGDEIARNRAEEDEILSRRPELIEETRGSSKNEPVKPPEVSETEWAEFRAWKVAQSRKPPAASAAPKPKPANRDRAPLARAAPKKKRQLSPEHLAKLQAGRARRWERAHGEKQELDQSREGNEGVQVGNAS